LSQQPKSSPNTVLLQEECTLTESSELLDLAVLGDSSRRGLKYKKDRSSQELAQTFGQIDNQATGFVEKQLPAVSK
jgi:hypothetical protein